MERLDTRSYEIPSAPTGKPALASRSRQIPFVCHVDVHTSKLAYTRHRKIREGKVHLTTTMGESYD
jgi:hypothetical protein